MHIHCTNVDHLITYHTQQFTLILINEFKKYTRQHNHNRLSQLCCNTKDHFQTDTMLLNINLEISSDIDAYVLKTEMYDSALSRRSILI